MAVRAIGEERIERGGYLSRVELPEFRASEYGWPSVIRHELVPGGDHPIDWSAVVSPTANRSAGLLIDDVPALAELVAFVRDDEELSTRLTLPTMRDSEYWSRWINYECLELVGSIIGRAVALGVEAENDLLTIYNERERAILDPKLPVEVVVPILLTHFDAEPLEVSSTVRIEKMDEPTQVARAARLNSNINPYLQAAATHAVTISGLELENPGPATRSITQDDQVDGRLIDTVFQALEIAAATPVGYAQVLLRPLGWSDGWVHDLPAIIRLYTARRYPPALDSQGWNRPGQSIASSELVLLPTIYKNLASASTRIELAARRLFQSDMRVNEDDILIDACIGIEALLGDGRDELTHRMSQRAAVALAWGSANADPHAIYELTKKIYAERSIVVHGGVRKKKTIKLGGKDFSTPQSAWALLRYLLLSALEADEAWTPAELDRRLLDSLADGDAEA